MGVSGGGRVRWRRGGLRALQPRVLELDGASALHGGPVRAAGVARPGGGPRHSAPSMSDRCSPRMQVSWRRNMSY